jgi:rifampin ADP-ribosylating transferase
MTSAVTSAFPSLYSNIARCYEDLSDPGNAKKNYELANSFRNNPSDKGPFITGQEQICNWRYADSRVRV